MDRITAIAIMAREFGHRISNQRIEGEWLVWDTSKSPRTLDLHAARARTAGVGGVFVRDGRVGCRDPEAPDTGW